MEPAMSFPSGDRTLLYRNEKHASVKDRIAAAFRAAMIGARSPAKELARVLDRTPKGAELLLRGETAPNLETIIAACREFDEVWEAFRDACGRADTASEAEALLAEITAKLRERQGR